MTERLSWDEICNRYPGQHLGLSHVETADGVNIISAIVEYSSENATRSDITRAVSNSNGTIVNRFVPTLDFQDLATTGYAGI